MTNMTKNMTNEQIEQMAKDALGPDYEIAMALIRIGDLDGYVEICKRRRYVSEDGEW